MMTAFFAAQAKASARRPPSPLDPIAPPPRPGSSHANLIVKFPLPTPAAETQCFLEDFRRLKGIDVVGSCAALSACAITPGILTHLPIARMMELTGLLEGQALIMQVFGKEWSASLEHLRLLDAHN